jgi:hypothetical protein
VKIWDVETGMELYTLAGHTDWVRGIALSADGSSLASAGHDGAVRIWHAATQTADWITMREAKALVNHLAIQAVSRDSLLAAVACYPSIDSTVREAATRQANSYLLHWQYLLTGHRAAERQDWRAAIAAFERVVGFAPDDNMHWYWLATASLAGGRHDLYQGASDMMLRRYIEHSDITDVHRLLKTWLTPLRKESELQRLERVLRERDHSQFGSYRFLYTLRTGGASRQIIHGWRTHDVLPGTYPEDWYILARAKLKAGERAEAQFAYREGRHSARSRRLSWDTAIYSEILQREVEDLLAADSGVERSANSHAPPSGEPSDSLFSPAAN